jgi:APA family basic amino acid/polyamine antiporter
VETPDPVPPHEKPRIRARAGLLPVLGLVYASTCGGPYQTENFVAPIGPGAFILLLFITPWFWGVPLAFATAELSIKSSAEGGYYRWAQHYLGDFWGFQAGIWSVFSSILDNALYPVLFARAVASVAPGLTALEQWLIAVGFIIVLTYVNYRGIRIAGAAAVGLNLFLIAPLIWLVVAASSHIRFNPFVPMTAPGIGTEFGTCLALSMWLYSGYDEVSTAGAEIANPSRNIPLALLIVTPLVVLSYALPTLAGLMAVGGWETWQSGQFVAIGRELGGPTLSRWLFLGSAASQTVVFLAYLLWWSRLMWVMADDGYLPSFLTKLHPRHGTPTRILLLSAVGCAVLASFRFENILVADIWLAGAYTLVIHACLVKARFSGEGNDVPGFQVPGGRVGVCINALIPLLTWLLLIATTGKDNLLLRAGLVLVGPLLYYVSRALRGPRLGDDSR